jgi:FKBP-type peptidyl-prolyl cis-trans isomerase FklB
MSLEKAHGGIHSFHSPRHIMKQRILLIAMAIMSVLGMASCSEDDGTVEEYPNWKVQNETFFNNLSDSVSALIKADPSRNDWKRIKSWTKAEDYTGTNEDYIIVKVVEQGPATETNTPIYTDTVAVHYAGSLLPSTSYKQGLLFDSSFDEPFDEQTSVVSTMRISATVEGFATALQNMHRGDHWIVYIPYQLGYGTVDKSVIPAYSTLVFDIRMKDFWRTKSSE